MHGKTALVTGGSSGIGKTVALAYLEAGAQVAIAARNSEALQRVADELATASGARVVPICCDVTQPEQVTSLVDEGDSRSWAGSTSPSATPGSYGSGMLDMPPEEFQSIQNTNVTGVFLTAQAAARAMVEQGQGGVIITTASMSGHIINIPQQVGHYCASKAAVIHLTKGMAVELAPHRIRVNSVSPGYIRTELVEPWPNTTRSGSRRFRLAAWAGPKNSPACTLSGQRGVQLHDRFRPRDRRRIHLSLSSRRHSLSGVTGARHSLNSRCVGEWIPEVRSVERVASQSDSNVAIRR